MNFKKSLSFLWFPVVILFEEAILRLASGASLMGASVLYILLFSLCFGMAFYLLSHICKAMPYILTWLISVFFCVQDIYYRVFGAYLVINSLEGANQAANSYDVILSSIVTYAPEIIAMLLPAIVISVFGRKILSFKQDVRFLLVALAFGVVCHIGGYFAVHADADAAYYYDNVFISQTSVWNYGMLTGQRLDIHHTLFGFKEEEVEAFVPVIPEIEVKEETPHKTVDFDLLSQNETDETLKEMHEYFASVPATYTNEYTDRFKGKNLILITAEAFSHYCIDEKLTPTLYKLQNEGFKFNNFYTPGWGVSTTDGEYVHLTGLIPKSGVWSFSRSSDNSLPYTVGMQSHKNGYEKVLGYHNHTYTYYHRDEYLTNIGYDYKGVGNGLELDKIQWPNSDLNMMEKTVDEYINADSFSVYYMTVSGHGAYLGNNIARKNMCYVEHLPYSFEVKNYLAANIELDMAVEYLIRRLSEAGKLEDTVISISADHYPYLLDEFDGLDELAGHPVEQKYERYKNAWLLWCGDMTEGVEVDTYCASMDILPTLSNMFGFEFDSRLLMGTDVFSGTEPVVIFQDQSWISQNGSYDARTGDYIKHAGATGEDDISAIKKSVRAKFKMSRQILELDYYRKVTQ
ncbi:MAG: sulfatase-like hydrolase/transferase [Clostridia bacterium]|nr:sulfatase-like hydrolase/transferase [Clostridia bacterium]